MTKDKTKRYCHHWWPPYKLEYGENVSLQFNIILQWMLVKGMRFYVQMLAPFIPPPYNSRMETDKEDTDQNKEHMGSEDFSPIVSWTQRHTQPVIRQTVGAEHQPFFSGHVPCTTFDLLNWK